MNIRVAVASSDGKFINQHFGHCRQFLIFALTENTEPGFSFVESRPTRAVCASGQHDDNLLEAQAELLADCKYVLASQIGPGAVRVLANKGITALAHPAFIDEALIKLGRVLRRNSQILRHI